MQSPGLLPESSRRDPRRDPQWLPLRLPSRLSLTFLGAALLCLASTGHAAQPESARPELEVAQAQGPGGKSEVRVQINTQQQPPPEGKKQWERFRDLEGRQWMAIWDADTNVPLRIFGQGIPAPGSVSDPRAAEAHAREILRKHIDLLAPGSRPEDFQMVSNHLSNRGVRSLGFVQTKAGRRVLGGQVSFRYKADRLLALGSEALPHVPSPRSAGRLLDKSRFPALAASWVAEESRQTKVIAVGELVALPLISAAGLRYHWVRKVVVDAHEPRLRFDVFLDAHTGHRVARRQTLRFADGTVFYNVPVRSPYEERQDFPVDGAEVVVNGETVVTAEDGSISWAGDAAASLTTSAQGPLARVVSQEAPSALTRNFTIEPDGSVVWNEENERAADAHLTAFVHSRLVKEFVRGLNPDLEWLDTELPVVINIDDSCNAFSDGNSINFFRESSQCANTALLADVVYHEFGHSMHSQSIIDGVGSFDGAFSEGISDFLAATITGDPEMGIGFFKTESPLRHIDPADREHQWPEDVAGVHFTGLIIGGAMWDLRELLIAQYGQEAGVALTNNLYYGMVQRSVNIPSSYVEILVEDDDDGNLANGTPNICDINAAFGQHGLRILDAEPGNLSVVSPEAEDYEVRLQVQGLRAECPGDTLDSATINWFLRKDNSVGGTIEMQVTEGGFVGTIPAANDGDVIRYRVDAVFSDGSDTSFPDNPADLRYEFYVGEIIELYCTDFEGRDPFEEGWSHALTRGTESEGADDWTWGIPASPPSSGDPPLAYSGENVVGNDIGGGEFNGVYQPRKTNELRSPAIDVQNYSDVRLQYRRWLTVEDGFFDQASIYSNDQLVWTNFNSDNGDDSAVHHQDREWRFHDVSLAGTIVDQKVQIRYELNTDAGLELGGWTIDDFCIVANVNAVCGDGVALGAEECDDGDANSDTEPGACRTSCLAASCGDGVVDQGEACDDGNTVDGDSCASDCLIADVDNGDCGCNVGAERPWTGSHTGLSLFAFVLVLILRRKRSA